MTGPREEAPRNKPYVLRPQAREDRRPEVHHYRQEAGAAVAKPSTRAVRATTAKTVMESSSSVAMTCVPGPNWAWIP